MATPSGDDDPLFRLAGELERRNVRWALMRGADRLDERGGDIDLALHPDDAAAFDAAAVECGFVVRRRWPDGSQRFLVACTGGRSRLLHVVTELGVGPPGYPWRVGVISTLLQRSVAPTPGMALRTVAPPDELWLSVYHCLLDKGSVAPHHAARFTELAAVGSPDDVLAGPLGRGLAGEVLSTLGADPTRLAELTDRVRRRVRRGQRVGGHLLAMRRRMDLVRTKAAERLGPPAVGVALLAPDGAGKSSTTSALVDLLPVEVVSTYLGLYPQGPAPTGFLGLPGVSFAARIGRLWRRWAWAWLQRRRGRIVIFDRHPVDARLPRDGTSALDRLRRGLLGRALPLPEVVVLLDAPGEVLHRRSGEHDPAGLAVQRRAYLQMVGGLDGAHVVDATASPEAVAAEVADIIWAAHRRRAHRRG